MSYLDMVTIAKTKWKSGFTVIYKNIPILIINVGKTGIQYQLLKF